MHFSWTLQLIEIFIKDMLKEKNVANNVNRFKFKGTMTKMAPTKNHLEQRESRKTTKRTRIEHLSIEV